MVLRKDTIYYQAFLLCTFTTTTGSDNFRKPEFFPSRTWVFFGRTWVFSWMDLSFPQIDKRSCQIWSKHHFLVVFEWYFTDFSRNLVSKRFYVSWKLRKTVLLKKIAPEFFQKPEFFSGTWVFQVHKKKPAYASPWQTRRRPYVAAAKQMNSQEQNLRSDVVQCMFLI